MTAPISGIYGPSVLGPTWSKDPCPTHEKSLKGVNISVILFVLVAGLFQADFSNWTWEPEGIYARLNNETESGNTTDCKGKSYFRSYFRPFPDAGHTLVYIF